MPKSILDFTIEDLEAVIKTSKMPDGTDLSPVITDNKLSRLVAQPHKLAKVLLTAKLSHVKGIKSAQYVVSPKTIELKERSLKIKEALIKVQKDKMLKQTIVFKEIQAIKRDQKFILDELKSLRQLIKSQTKEVKK